MSEVHSGHIEQQTGTIETRVVEALSALQLAWDSLRLVRERSNDMRRVQYSLRPKPEHEITIVLMEHNNDVSIYDPNSERVIERRTITSEDEFVADDVHFATHDVTGKKVPYIRFSSRVGDSTYWELELTGGLDAIDITVAAQVPSE